MARRAGYVSPTALRSAMARTSATAEDLAVMLEVSTSTIEGWLSARRVPEPPQLARLARALRVQPADLTLVAPGEERLHDLRVHAGLLQADVSHASGLRQPQLSKMERGVVAPKIEVCEILASIYGVDAERVRAAWSRTRDDRKRHAESKLA